MLVGSPNLDPRSGKLNTEIGILFESEPLANGLADWFDDNQAHIAYRVSLDRSQFTTNPRVSSDVIQLLRYGKKASDPGRALIKVASIVWKFPRIEK